MRRHAIRTLFAAGALAVALPATAQVSGNWTGNMATPNGDVAIGYTFMEDGETLTGTSTGPDGTPIEISDGKIDGNNVSFSITVDFGGMPFTMLYSGVVMDDTIEFTIDMFGMPFPLTATRVADE